MLKAKPALGDRFPLDDMAGHMLCKNISRPKFEIVGLQPVHPAWLTLVAVRGHDCSEDFNEKRAPEDKWKSGLE